MSGSRLTGWPVSLLLLVSALVFGAYQFMSVGTATTGATRYSSDSINGYTVTNVTYYTNDDGNPTTLDGVILNVNSIHSGPAPTTVKLKLVSAGSTWFDCANTGTQWFCQISPPVQVTAVNELSIVAAR